VSPFIGRLSELATVGGVVPLVLWCSAIRQISPWAVLGVKVAEKFLMSSAMSSLEKSRPPAGLW
jgi:hypothetical protein